MTHALDLHLIRAPRIYEGASEIQREIIARGLFRAAEDRRAETSG